MLIQGALSNALYPKIGHILSWLNYAKMQSSDVSSLKCIAFSDQQ